MLSWLMSRPIRISIYATMLVILFIYAYIPLSAVVVGPWHFELHFVAFAIVGGVTGWALSCITGFWQALIIIALPFIHEICEIRGHQHPLEVNDIMVDIVGGIVGLLVIRLLKKMLSMIGY